MTRKERLQFCGVCLNRKMDLQKGLLCGLTMQQATFEDNCTDFKLDEAEKSRKERIAMEAQQSEDDGDFFAPEKSGLKKGIFGGVLMMVIALVWFFVGLAGDVIFYYPPILFVIGLIGFIRGIFQGNINGEKSKT
ncbi:hypothetical protein [Flexithrix dorotheae]|uniref:hypothetical protein n=1 Tax=Flexithrix dorotheae TaxID=70993 RepID=UPI0003A0A3FF|nr:hypothetical protein [Flexithrix dorotheae]